MHQWGRSYGLVKEFCHLGLAPLQICFGFERYGSGQRSCHLLGFGTDLALTLTWL